MKNNYENKKYLHELFSDKDKTLEMFDFFIRKSVEEEKKEQSENREFDIFWIELFENTLKTYYKQNIDFIYKYAESEIEKAFLNSLNFAFLKADPLSFKMIAPTANTIEHIEQYQKEHQEYQKFYNAYKKKTGDMGGKNFKLFLEKLKKEEKMTDQEHSDILTHHLVLDGMNFYNAFHLIIQARFPEIKIKEKSIRADLFIWIPGNEKFKLIVECDGFKFHSNKDSFVLDRKRDRLLHQKGFEVFRYSGSEIFNDPIESANSLFYYLGEKQETNEMKKR